MEGARRQTDEAGYDREVEEKIRDFLRDVNERDPAALAKRNDRLAEVKNAIEDYIDDSISLLFGGSVSRRTDVEGISDVDALVLLNDNRYVAENPQDLLSEFADLLRRELPVSVAVERGDLAVTLKFDDGMELQLLPALKTATGVRIAASDGDGWSNVIHPERFARRLTETNEANRRLVIPVIKVVRQMVEQFPQSSKPRGHHIEALAIEAFQGYQGKLTTKAMLEHFIQAATNRVKAPITDQTGQSDYLDDYLGGHSSGGRQRMSNEFAGLGARLRAADDDLSVQTWLDALGM
jgi:hypothetical protein